MNGLTLDTGALIALERKGARALLLVEAARRRGQVITVPSVVVIEWWRGQHGPVARLLEAFDIEPLTEQLARIAGAALAKAGTGPSAVDAAVMASAAQRGDAVLTGDFDDLSRLQAVFGEVRLLAV